ncbi:hypothetical protein K2W90_04780 [Candidatus Babeliales bacterium]|nr:hypothetical protein [Candidatus Babeliales bacterium]
MKRVIFFTCVLVLSFGSLSAAAGGRRPLKRLHPLMGYPPACAPKSGPIMRGSYDEKKQLMEMTCAEAIIFAVQRNWGRLHSLLIVLDIYFSGVKLSKIASVCGSDQGLDILGQVVDEIERVYPSSEAARMRRKSI